MVHIAFDTEPMQDIHNTAQSVYNVSSLQVKELAALFFLSMDTNCDDMVSWSEIQNFFQGKNLLIQPPFTKSIQHKVFKEIDGDRDGSLNFPEFVTFFYCLFFRVHCNICRKNLLGWKCYTCVTCFTSAVTQNECYTYDLCNSCFPLLNYSNMHHHPSNQFNDYKDFMYNEFRAAVSSSTSNTNCDIEAKQERVNRLFNMIQLGAAVATIGAAVGCSIM